MFLSHVRRCTSLFLTRKLLLVRLPVLNIPPFFSQDRPIPLHGRSNDVLTAARIIFDRTTMAAVGIDINGTLYSSDVLYFAHLAKVPPIPYSACGSSRDLFGLRCRRMLNRCSNLRVATLVSTGDIAYKRIRPASAARASNSPPSLDMHPLLMIFPGVVCRVCTIPISASCGSHVRVCIGPRAFRWTCNRSRGDRIPLALPSLPRLAFAPWYTPRWAGCLTRPTEDRPAG